MERFIGGLNHFKSSLAALLFVQINLGVVHQTSDDLLEVFLLGRISVLLAALDSREESGVVIIVLVSGEKQMNETSLD